MTLRLHWDRVLLCPSGGCIGDAIGQSPLNSGDLRTMLKIYDCSNSTLRPSSRGLGCPVENDIIRYLKENAHRFNCTFTSLEDADIVITNDVFPSEVLATGKPKVKRMDGVFSYRGLLDRNVAYNIAALQADHVIFISEFSRQSYFKLYGHPLNNNSVILNVADDKVFYPNPVPYTEPFTWVAQASDWSRIEKRFYTIIKFAFMFPYDRIKVIGKFNEYDTIPSNMTMYGYVSDHTAVAKIYNDSHAMINLSYKDAAPKVVTQAVSCGLPVLYANSGGVPEIVTSGEGVKDGVVIKFDSKIPKLSLCEMATKANLIKDNYKKYKKNVKRHSFETMLKSYYDVIFSTL